MLGTVDYVKLLTGPRAGDVAFAIVLGDDGQRFFMPPGDAPAGLARGDRVAFDPDRHADPRGPIAVRVRLLERAASPPPPETRVEDMAICCVSCGTSFVWSSGERAFYRSRNFNPPRRCKPCRRARAAAPHGTP